MPCRHYDCGFCYYIGDGPTTARQGACNAMEDCPQSVKWDNIIGEPPLLLKLRDDGDDNEEHW